MPPHTVSKAPRPNGANNYRFRRSSLIRLSLLRHPCLSHVICANGFRRHRGGSRCNSSSNGVVFSCRCTPISQAQDCLCKKLFLAAPLSGEGITWFPPVFSSAMKKTQLTLGLWGGNQRGFAAQVGGKRLNPVAVPLPDNDPAWCKSGRRAQTPRRPAGRSQRRRTSGRR